MYQLNLPFASTLMGRNAVNETHPNYIGLYMGQLSLDHIIAQEKETDAIIVFGGLHNAEFNIDNFNMDWSDKKVIQLFDNHVYMDDHYIQDVWLHDVVNKLTFRNKKNIHYYKPNITTQLSSNLNTHQPLSQDVFWHTIQPLINNKDVVFEVGTSLWTSISLSKGSSNNFLGSFMWLSIGYAIPALIGSMFARPNVRHVGFIGDGSAQETIQGISTMLRHKQNPIIFLLNNDGYTIERVIYGEKSHYNDISMWDYTQIPSAFTLHKDRFQTYKVHTQTELTHVLEVLPDDKLVFIEVILERMDIPSSMRRILQKPSPTISPISPYK